MKAITVKFHDDQYERIKQICREKRCSFGYVVRAAIQLYLDSIS